MACLDVDAWLRRPRAGAATPPARAPAAADGAAGAAADSLDALERAFAATGGIASADAVLRLMRTQRDQPLSQLARWIVAHQLVSFDRDQQTLVPLFQFERPGMVLRAGLADVLRELPPAFDEPARATWFATPHPALGQARPADRLADEPARVREAARVTRGTGARA